MLKKLWTSWVWAGVLLLGTGCAAGPSAPGDAGGGDGMDAQAPVDASPPGDPDAGPTTPEDAGPDAGPIDTTGLTCAPCNTDDDCEFTYYCATVGVGGRVCLPGCVPDLPHCPSRFNCVESYSERLTEPVCAPVGERCCVDEDEDGHGDGVGCLGLDCDDDDPDTHAGAAELCDGLDNNCNGEIDEGDPLVMCPRGEHVAATACTDGACVVETCEPGFADCDLDPSNGCETPTSTESSCGACGMVCDPANATGDCASGMCRVGMCDPGFGDCDGDPSNGCETPLDTVGNCGGCGISCAPAGAIGDCSTGTCEIGTCNPHRGDCDMNPANGCETTLTTNTDCGGCGNICSPTGGAGDCSTGTCQVSSCGPGSADCDMNAANGCETNTRTLSDCGGCGVTCSHDRGLSSCASGSCNLIGCAPGYGNCDGIDGNGCEQSLDTMNHCGACGSVCTIANGVGDCSSGTCQIASCNPGWADCDGNVANGCEQQLNTNDHCGGCGVTCALAHAGASCASGICQVTSCDPLWGNCDGSHPNGCERSLQTTTNCGGCGVPCTRPNASTSCSGGTCAFASCNTGYSNCDNNTGNGCEVNHRAVSGSCGGGVNVGAYDGDTKCGVICGSNNGWDNFATRTGRNSAWYRARVREDSTCSARIEHRIRLEVPAGIDYDLYVYRSSTCGSWVGRSINGTGVNETVVVGESDSSGSDDDFDYFVEVRYVSGRSCTPYTIRFDGHNC